MNIFHLSLRRALCPLTMTTLKSQHADNEFSKVEETITSDLISADLWFAQNGMKRNSSNYQAMVLAKNNGTDEPVYKCEE